MKSELLTPKRIEMLTRNSGHINNVSVEPARIVTCDYDGVTVICLVTSSYIILINQDDRLPYNANRWMTIDEIDKYNHNRDTKQMALGALESMLGYR